MAVSQSGVLQDVLFFHNLNRQREEDNQRQDEQYALAKEAQQLQLQEMRGAASAPVDSEPYSLGPSRTTYQLPEEVAARRELARAQAYLGKTAQGGGTNATYAQDAQQDLADIEPLVRGGVLGADDVRAVVKSAAMGGITDQRNTRKADRVMQAIMRNTENGTFNEGQTAGAIESAEKEFGPDVLLNSSAYTKLKGLQEQMHVARELQKFEAAEQMGVDPNVLTYNEEGKLVRDDDVVAIEQYKMVKQEHEAKQADILVTAKRKNLEVQINAIGAQIRSTNTLLAATKDPSYINVLNKLTVEQHKLLNQLADTGTQGVAAPSQPSAAATSKQYKSKDEFLNALKTGQHQVGEPGMVAGVKVKAFPNGDIKRVQ